LGLRDNVAALALLAVKQHDQPTAAAPANGGGGGGRSPTKRRRVSSPGADAPAAGAAPPLVAVANTHVLFNPKRGDIKLGQLRLLAAALARLARGAGAGGGGGGGDGGSEARREPAAAQVALLLMGDLNLAPHSPVYEFVARGELDCMMHQRRDLSGGRGDVMCVRPRACARARRLGVSPVPSRNALQVWGV
jgi:endonuclease/exonuclease/phosphatase family metal-dependent hydrolase